MRAIRFNGRGRIEEVLSILLGGTLAVIILLIICGSGMLELDEQRLCVVNRKNNYCRKECSRKKIITH